jgi:hypothetical protein
MTTFQVAILTVGKSSLGISLPPRVPALFLKGARIMERVPENCGRRDRITSCERSPQTTGCHHGQCESNLFRRFATPLLVRPPKPDAFAPLGRWQKIDSSFRERALYRQDSACTRVDLALLKPRERTISMPSRRGRLMRMGRPSMGRSRGQEKLAHEPRPLG